VKLEKPTRSFFSGDALVREDYIQLSRLWPDTANRNLTADLLDVAGIAIYLLVSLPLYLVACLALALALYVRCAGVLLLAE
jgi:hypothetical protein